MSVFSIQSYIAVPPLREWGFGRMLLVAMVAHACILFVVSLWPHEQVEHVPARVLSFQLGEGMFLAPEIPEPEPATVPENAAPVSKVVSKPLPTPKPAAPKKQLVRQAPAENTRVDPEENFLSRIWNGASQRRLPPAEQPGDEAEQMRKSLLQQSPKQYVRQYGLPSIDSVLKTPPEEIDATISELTTWEDAPAIAEADAGNGEAAQPTKLMSPELIRQRYEQRISAWIAQHKLYPPTAAGKEGQVVVRIRIDRLGYVRFYAIEESSGVKALDNAAIDMVKRANPLPRPPVNYPAGELIEFLIPIGFAPPV